MIANAPFVAVVLIATVGLATLLMRRNLIKMIMGITILEAAVNLLLVAVGYRHDAIAPIYTNAPISGTPTPEQMVMPTVQAMTLTAIVIGLATLALLLSMTIIVYRRYGTLSATKMNKLKG